QPAELLAPPIIRHLAHPDLANGVHHVLALRDQNIDLPQLRDDLFRLVSLPCHCSPPGCQRHTSSRTTSMGVDHDDDCNLIVAVYEPNPATPALGFVRLLARSISMSGKRKQASALS